MTPKEKAWDLTLEFRFRIDSYFQPEQWGMVDYHNIQLKKAAKDCAILSVEEIINQVYSISHKYTAIYDDNTKFWNYTESKELNFWKEVEKEIEAL